MTSISTRTSLGRRATSTVDRAGGGDVEESPVDFVHRGEVTHVLQEHGRAHHISQPAAGGSQDCGQILEYALRLRRHVPADHLLVRRIDGHLPGDENKSARSDRLGVRANGLWAIRS
jgi:hypothetical protein